MSCLCSRAKPKSKCPKLEANQGRFQGQADVKLSIGGDTYACGWSYRFKPGLTVELTRNHVISNSFSACPSGPAQVAQRFPAEFSFAAASRGCFPSALRTLNLTPLHAIFRDSLQDDKGNVRPLKKMCVFDRTATAIASRGRTERILTDFLTSPAGGGPSLAFTIMTNPVSTPVSFHTFDHLYPSLTFEPTTASIGDVDPNIDIVNFLERAFLAALCVPLRKTLLPPSRRFWSL
jgi:hypothetical protein